MPARQSRGKRSSAPALAQSRISVLADVAAADCPFEGRERRLAGTGATAAQLPPLSQCLQRNVKSAPTAVPDVQVSAGSGTLADTPRTDRRVEHHPVVDTPQVDRKAEHKLMNSRAKHRGPMDEMRQLVRILAKMMPQSQGYLQVGDEGGGGNRISETQIKHYLAATLGNLAPKPEWGLPQGWGQYLADLFNWVKSTPGVITADEARQCARRMAGRPWEIVPEQLAVLGIAPETWPLPLDPARIVQQFGAPPAQQFENRPAQLQSAPDVPNAEQQGLRGSPERASKRQKVEAPAAAAVTAEALSSALFDDPALAKDVVESMSDQQLVSLLHLTVSELSARCAASTCRPGVDRAPLCDGVCAAMTPWLQRHGIAGPAPNHTAAGPALEPLLEEHISRFKQSLLAAVRGPDASSVPALTRQAPLHDAAALLPQRPPAAAASGPPLFVPTAGLPLDTSHPDASPRAAPQAATRDDANANPVPVPPESAPTSHSQATQEQELTFSQMSFGGLTSQPLGLSQDLHYDSQGAVCDGSQPLKLLESQNNDSPAFLISNALNASQGTRCL